MVAAAVTAAAFICRPAPGLGTVTYTRSARRHVVDLATCHDSIVGTVSQRSRRIAGITIRSTGHGRAAKQTIWANGRPIFTEPQYSSSIGPGDTPGPIWLLQVSRDRRWLFFTIDPGSSASIAQDGLVLRVISLHGGPVHELGEMLPYPDHVAWCHGQVVFSGGLDRLAWHHKRLLTAAPPAWQVQPLVPGRGRAWGSLVCGRDGKSVIVQSQHASDVASFAAGHWALWQVGLDGAERQLTHPPAHAADESPALAGRTLFFVRTRRLHGVLYALRGTRIVGPFAWLGYSFGWYGHHDWPYTPR